MERCLKEQISTITLTGASALMWRPVVMQRPEGDAMHTHASVDYWAKSCLIESSKAASTSLHHSQTSN